MPKENARTDTPQSPPDPSTMSDFDFFMAAFLGCCFPDKSSEDSRSAPVVSSRRGIFADMPATLHFPEEPLTLAATRHQFEEKEYAARSGVEKTFHDELMQIEALFCVFSEKVNMADVALVDGMALAARQLFFISTMQLAEKCVNTATALAPLQVEEANARHVIVTEYKNTVTEYENTERQLKEEHRLLTSYDIVSTDPRFFQQSPPAAPSASQSWAAWLFGR